MKAIVPYVISAGQTLSPHEVNENARRLWESFLQLERKRYNYFTVLAYIGQLEDAATDGAVEGQFVLRAPFPLEIVSSEIVAWADDDGTPTSTETITLSSDLSGWEDLSIEVVHAASVTAQHHAIEAQSILLPADTTGTFSVSQPATGAKLVGLHVVLHCRYDFLSESTYTRPDPPAVMDGDTHSITAWNTWFSNMATAIGLLSTAYKSRKRVEVINFHREFTDGGGNGPTDLGTFVDVPLKAATLEEARLFQVATAGTSDYGLYSSNDVSVVAGSTSLTAPGVTVWNGSGDGEVLAYVGDPTADDATVDYMQVQIDTGAQTWQRLYLLASYSN